MRAKLSYIFAAHRTQKFCIHISKTLILVLILYQYTTPQPNLSIFNNIMFLVLKLLIRSIESFRCQIAMGLRPSSYVVRRPSSVIRRALTSSSQELRGQSKSNLVCSVCKVRRQEIVNIMTPPHQREGNFGVKSVKLLYF